MAAIVLLFFDLLSGPCRQLCICVPNLKFVCLNLWLGELCTDDANDDANTNANDDNARRTKHDCFRLFG